MIKGYIPLKIVSCDTKIRYETKNEALRIAKMRKQRGKEQLGAYPCPYCHGFHLTKIHGKYIVGNNMKRHERT